MIVTCKGRIPFLWILFAALPWSAGMFKFMVMGSAFIFSLKKFVDNPAGLTLIMSLPGIVSLVSRPFINFMSDRIWTRFGRRKPFVATGWIGAILCIGLMPLMPNFWMLLGAYLAYNVFNDVGEGPIETLKQEIVPPPQRGTSTAIGTWIFNFAILTFNLVAIGRFDDYKFMAGVPFTGEQSIYWSTCAAMVMMLLLITLGIRELEQQSKLRGERFSLGNFFRAILNRNLWPVYLIITGWGILNAGLGPMSALLYTDQWQFTKQDMGYNFVIGGVLNIFLIAIVGLFADKLPRMKAYQMLMALSMTINFCFYLYVHHVLYDQTPTLVELVIFGETMSVIGILMQMIYLPLVYDYVPRNELGTYAAGAAITNKVTAFITLNGVGLFIWAYAAIFLPPGGEMARVVFAQPKTNSEVSALIAHSTLATNHPGQRISAEAWYATHAALDYGRGFELRVKNDDSLKLKEHRDKLEGERSILAAKEVNARGFAEAQLKKGNLTGQQHYLAQAEELKQNIIPLAAEIKKSDDELIQRAETFRGEIANALGQYLLPDGEQIRAGFTQPVLICDYALKSRPYGDGIEKTLNHLRQTRSDMIDLRLVRRADGWALSASAEMPVMTNAEHLGEEMGKALAEAGEKYLRGALVLPVVPVAERKAEAVGLELLALEDPLDNHPSPITKGVYRFINQFGDAPRPERRIWAMARALRAPGICDNISVRVVSGGENVIRVLSVCESNAVFDTSGLEPLTPQVAGRIQNLFFNNSHEQLEQAISLYRRIIPAAAQNRITVARPFVTASFATMKYDYMSGYIWMLLVSILALGITIMFTRREARGLIHKRGREEAEMEQKAEESVAFQESHGDPEAGKYYTPGYFWPKVGMMALGGLLVAVAMVSLGPDLRLLIFGTHAQAVATQVIKQKVGGAEKVLSNDAEIMANEEHQDRSFIFWNEYQINLPDGKMVNFRAPSGSQLKPAHNLLDSDGLPTTVTVFCDPAHPQSVLLPNEYSTWFVPGALGGFGLLGVFAGCVLAYYSRKRIALPVLPELSTDAKDAN